MYIYTLNVVLLSLFYVKIYIDLCKIILHLPKNIGYGNRKYGS